MLPGSLWGVMDGLPGVGAVFKEEFPKAKIQRCQVHVARNVPAKVPQKFKQEVAGGMRFIFYPSCRDKARQFFKAFKERWEKHVPSAGDPILSEKSPKTCPCGSQLQG